MNDNRRKRLQAVVMLLDEIRAEEEEAMDNLPEAIYDGEKGQRMGEIVAELEEVGSLIEEVIE